MASTYTKWERFYQKLNMIFHGIVAFTMIPFAWVFLETQGTFADQAPFQGEEGIVLKTVLIVVAASLLGYSFLFGKKQLERARAPKELADRLSGYLTAKVLHYAMVETATMVAVVGLFLTHDQLFSFVYVAALFVFSLGRPTFDRVVQELQLSKEEQEALKKSEF